MNYIYLICAFILNGTANILLKIGAGKGLYLQILPLGMFIKQNVYFISGFILFVLNAFFYFLALKHVPVSLAYPIMITMSLLIIGVYAFSVGGEQFTYMHAVSYALIVLGVVLLFANTK